MSKSIAELNTTTGQVVVDVPEPQIEPPSDKDGKFLDTETSSYDTDTISDVSLHKLKGDIHTATIPVLLAACGPKMATSMAWAAQWAALSPYLESMLPSWAVQVTQFIGPITGMLIAPSLGLLSDNTTHKWGRRHPYLVWGTVATIPCWILMGFTREIGTALGDTETNRTWTAVFMILTYLWMDISVNIVSTPSQLLIADMAGNRQFLGSTLGQALAVFGNILLSLWFIFLGNPARNLLTFLVVLSAILAITVAIAFFVCKEPPFVPAEPKKTSQLVKQSFSSIYIGLKTMPKMLLILCVSMGLWSYGSMAYGAAKAQYFGLVVMDGQAQGSDTCGKPGYSTCTPEQDAYNQGVALAGGLTDLISNVVGFLILFTIPFTVRRIGAKWTLLSWMTLQCLLLVMAFVKIVAVNVVMAVLVNLASTVLYGMLYAIAVHIIDDKDKNGLYFGAINVFGTAGQLLNFALAAVLVSTPMGYALPVLLGGMLAIVAWLNVAVFFKVKIKAL